LDAKGRTLVSVRYALEGSIEKNVELARITPVQIPQHASVRPLQRTTIATTPPPREETMMARQEYIDKPIELLLHLAYSTKKGLRWRRKQLGLVGSDVKDKRFRQCLLSNYLLLKAYLQLTTTLTQIGNYGQWASQTQRNNPHSIAYLCIVA
jgi:hypothetical protein